MSEVSELRATLLKIPPEHDSPMGVAHPYWARKPMNLIEAIVRTLTKENALVVDPFMGSGTTVFAALRAKRRVVGGDISSLSHFLVAASLDLIESHRSVLPELRRILDDHRRITLPWFDYGDGSIIDRVRYDVDGEFKHGRYELWAREVVTKTPIGSRWVDRTSHLVENGWRSTALSPNFGDSISSPVDFELIKLPPNTRIAIPAGATLSQFFTPENRASINVLLDLIGRSPLAQNHRAALSFVLSSALPQLRLSDRKASSQWPFWRPRRDLTSRNPVLVLGDRLHLVENLVKWGTEQLTLGGNADPRYQLFLGPAQALDSSVIGGMADLVLTDPPYGDQVPYGEYSELWNGVLGLTVADNAASTELVRSNASHRQADSKQYLERLESAFAANAALVRPGGHLVWFYQDQDLECWRRIARAAATSEMALVDVIALPKQRRSLKSLTSPNTTLDGDLICVFRQERDARRPKSHSPSNMQALGEAVRASGEKNFDRYAVMIEHALKHELIAELADEFGTVKRALAQLIG